MPDACSATTSPHAWYAHEALETVSAAAAVADVTCPYKISKPALSQAKNIFSDPEL